ncbi:MAG: hypothetical protein RLZZ238_2029 [Planctomycetota bacterium]|jgi:hypothetical protein
MGIATILIALSNAALVWFDGDPGTNIDFAASFAAITAGIGLLKAADAKKAADAQ